MKNKSKQPSLKSTVGDVPPLEGLLGFPELGADMDRVTGLLAGIEVDNIVELDEVGNLDDAGETDDMDCDGLRDKGTSMQPQVLFL